MRKLIRNIVLVAAVCCLGRTAWGDVNDPNEWLIWNIRDAMGTPITLGQWHAGWQECKNFAEANGVPIFAVYTHWGCGNCKRINTAGASTNFLTWAKTSGIVLCYIKGHSGTPSSDGAVDSDAAGGETFCDASYLSYYPLCRFYYSVNGTTIFDHHYEGNIVDNTMSGESGGAKMVTFLSNLITQTGYTAKPIYTYNGGQFGVTNSPNARLEAEYGVTTNVTVPLVRAADLAKVATNNLLLVKYPDNTTKTLSVSWAVGQTNATIAVPTSKTTSTGTITLILEDGAGKGVETNAITYVPAQENSGSNPLWIGERTTTTLKAGEWTMDLDVATNRTAKQSGAAYTLVNNGGPLWCPDCLGAETTLLARVEFKTWATSHNVALVAIDQPRYKVTSPTLLRDEVCTASGLGNGKSGTPYLSRKMIDRAAAEAIAQRNLNLTTNVWKLPQDAAAWRLSNPTFLLLRKDGTIAGRLNAYETELGTRIENYPTTENILRLNELLELANDPSEEKNGDLSTTTLGIGPAETVSQTLQANDLIDVFKLTNIVTGVRTKISVSTASSLTAPVTVQIVQVTATATNTLGTATGDLAAGFAVTADITGTGPCYAIVTGSSDAAAFSPSNTATTIRPYRLTSSFVLVPQEAAGQIALPAGDVPVVITNGTIYRFAASAGTISVDSAEFDTVDAANGLYRAKASGEAKVTLSQAATFTYQEWRPGTVAFSVTAQSVSEGAKSFTLTVSRTGGSSDAVQAKVSLSPNGTAVVGDRFTWDNDVNLAWADGASGSTNITVTVKDDQIYDGDQTAIFDLTLLSGLASLGANTNQVVTILENDEPAIGKLAITATVPAFTRGTTLLAKENSTVTLSVTRTNGAESAVSTTFKVANATGVAVNGLSWKHNDEQPTKDVSFTVPSFENCRNGSFTVTLVPSGIPVMSGKDRVNVTVIANDAPEFTQSAPTIQMIQYVAVSNPLAIASTQGGLISVTKLSGLLPSGLSLSVDSATKAAVFAGTPTRAGTFVSSWQVSERRDGKTVKGLTMQLTCVVKGITEVNSSLTKTKVVANCLVYEPTGKRLTGLMRLTVPATGWVTGSYDSYLKRVSFVSKGWSGCDEASGSLTATFVSGGYTGTVTVAKDGSITGTMADPAFTNLELEVAAFDPDWNRTNSAAAYAGYYTVNLTPDSFTAGSSSVAACGHGFLTLNMKSSYAQNNGTMTYAGILPDGTSVSGSGTLLPDTDAVSGNYVYLPIFKRTGREVLAGMLHIKADAAATHRNDPRVIYSAPDISFYWTHTEKEADASYELLMDAFGGYYDRYGDLEKCCSEDYSTTNMEAKVLSEKMGASLAYGNVAGVPDIYLNVSSLAIRMTQRQQNPYAFRLSFNKATGVFSGTFRIAFSAKTITATYRGIVLPGWADCGCGKVVEEAKPFGLGACWYTEPFATESGKTMTIRRGCPVEFQPVLQ